ncbi:unnamed protein product [Rotaria sp. Silwood1]|nr:unnamed protein product [Rotaria sp. Silwood1]
MSSNARTALQQNIQVSVIGDDNNTVTQENPQAIINHRQVNVEVSAGTPVPERALRRPETAVYGRLQRRIRQIYGRVYAVFRGTVLRP